jgi:riboflavin synthase alpha subunit
MEINIQLRQLRKQLIKLQSIVGKKGDSVNLERRMKLGDRLDGHMIQGHVDQIGTCVDGYNERR